MLPIDLPVDKHDLGCLPGHLDEVGGMRLGRPIAKELTEREVLIWQVVGVTWPTAAIQPQAFESRVVHIYIVDVRVRKRSIVESSRLWVEVKTPTAWLSPIQLDGKVDQVRALDRTRRQRYRVSVVLEEQIRTVALAVSYNARPGAFFKVVIVGERQSA